MRAFEQQRGTVVAFDEDEGIGCVEADDGTRLFFHCTQIADGTRTIAVATPVSFEVRAGRGGQWEAYALSGLSRPSPL
jgi:cold shock CspA family protein